jgi:hypothetical protein
LRAISRALQIARSNIFEKFKAMRNKIQFFNQDEDDDLLPGIRQLADQPTSEEVMAIAA